MPAPRQTIASPAAPVRSRLRRTFAAALLWALAGPIQAGNSEDTARANGVWTVRAGEPLAEIAERLLPGDGALQRRLMDDLRLAQAGDFIDVERGLLRVGTVLKLPDYALVLPAGEANGEVAEESEQGDVAARVEKVGAGLRASGDNGRVRPLGPGDALGHGETLLSGLESSELLLANGSRLTLRPRSVVLLPPAEAVSEHGVQQLQLVRGGLRVISDATTKFRVQHKQARVELDTHQFSLRHCSGYCDAEVELPPGLYGIARDGQVELESPAGKQRFDAGSWFHLPSDGEPASAMTAALPEGFDIPTAKSLARAAETPTRLDARTLRQLGKKISPLVYSAISGGLPPETGKPDKKQPVSAFLPGGKQQVLGFSLRGGAGEGDKLWVEGQNVMPRIRLKNAANIPMFIPRSAPVSVPRYSIATPNLPSRDPRAAMAMLLNDPRDPATLGGLCYGSDCDDSATPLLQRPGPRRDSERLLITP